MNVDMAKRLADRRRAMGLSQEALAARLGVSRQAVSKWERSESSPDTDNLIALAALYEVSLDDLLYRDVADEARRMQDEGAQGAGGAVAAPGCEEEAREAATGELVTAGEPEPQGDPSGAPAAGAAGSTSEEAVPSDLPGEGFPKGGEDKVRIGPGGIHVQGEGEGADYVHISWRDGVHVRDGSKGDEVHVGWDGVHVNDRSYSGWRDAHADWEGRAWPPEPQSRGWRNWNLFPFPLLVIVAYLFTSLQSGGWVPDLGLFLSIPVYYALGGLLFGKRLCTFLCTLYAVGALGWFFQMCLGGQPHPAWVVLLTIPLVNGLFVAVSHWWGRRAQA